MTLKCLQPAVQPLEVIAATVVGRTVCELVRYLALGGQTAFGRVTSHLFYWVYYDIVTMIYKTSHHLGLCNSTSVEVGSSWTSLWPQLFHYAEGILAMTVYVRNPST